jgi:hypothetical protein
MNIVLKQTHFSGKKYYATNLSMVLTMLVRFRDCANRCKGTIQIFLSFYFMSIIYEIQKDRKNAKKCRRHYSLLLFRL